MKSLSSVLLLLVAVGCSGDDPVGIDTDLLAFSRIGADKTVKMVPFRGRHSAMDDAAVYPDPDDCPSPNAPGGTTIIEGTATHLGTFTGSTVGCIHIGTFFNPNNPYEFLISELTWIGANGDEVRLSLYGAGQVWEWDFDAGKLVVTLEYEITGGSGRFDGAEGHVVMVVTVLLDGSGPNQATWEGTISSPGSIR